MLHQVLFEAQAQAVWHSALQAAVPCIRLKSEDRHRAHLRKRTLCFVIEEIAVNNGLGDAMPAVFVSK